MCDPPHRAIPHTSPIIYASLVRYAGRTSAREEVFGLSATSTGIFVSVSSCLPFAVDTGLETCSVCGSSPMGERGTSIIGDACSAQCQTIWYAYSAVCTTVMNSFAVLLGLKLYSFPKTNYKIRILKSRKIRKYTPMFTDTRPEDKCQPSEG